MAFTNHTLPDRIRFLGETNPDTPAFIFWSPAGRRVLSRGDVLDLSSRFAYRLSKNGVKPGDVVCIALPNSPERVVVEFGVQLAGAVSMNGQVLRADGEDLIETLIKAECSYIVLDPDQQSGAWQVCKHAFDSCTVYNLFREIKSKRIPTLTKIFISRTTGSKNRFLDTLHEEQKMLYENGKPQDTCSIFTTSGSTGYSKLVPHKHASLLSFADEASRSISTSKQIHYFNNSPFGWLGGYPILYLCLGSTWVAIDEVYGEIPDKSAFISYVLYKENINLAVLLPSSIQAIIEHRRSASNDQHKHRLSNLFTGGMPIAKETVAIARELTDCLTVGYGSTELGFISKIEITNFSSFLDNLAGYPCSKVKVKVTDPDYKDVPPLTTGEILVKSPTLTTGYIGESVSSNQNFLPDGWFRTGDIGFLRDDGCLFVEGRSSDAIMHGAYILYPTWLEQKLINCPGVKEVVIVPVPDKVLHHEICACVKLDDTSDTHPSAEDIIGFCQKETVLDQSSSLNVIPKYVIFLKEFPLTKTNKLDRRGLAESAREQLQL